MNSCIHFIRHGQTEGTEKKWYYGAADLSLTEQGKVDTKRLEEEGTYPKWGDAQYFTSGLLRAEQTLEIIYGKVPHRQIPMLKEMNFGIYECKSFAQLDGDEFFMKWCYDEEGNVQVPEGESRNQFAERVSEGLTELRRYHMLKELSHRHSGKDAVTIMVCHGGVISASLMLMFPGEKKNIWDWIPDPGHGYTVFFEKGEPAGWKRF